ncbi:MAG: acetolactate decarboxylase [Methanosarcinales archaeon]
MSSKRSEFLILGLVLISLGIIFSGCVKNQVSEQQGTTLLVVNKVEDLLAGDLWEYRSLDDLAPLISKAEILGLGTTSREHNGEILFFTEDSKRKCIWADPVSKSYNNLQWTDEKLPFCAIALLDSRDVYIVKDVTGDIHEKVIDEIKKQGINRAAVRIDGSFDKVKVSIAYHLPKTGLAIGTVHAASDNFREAHITVEHEWTMVGFYTNSESEQKIISVKGKPLHLHGIERDGKIGGHIVKANSTSSTIKIYPIKDYKIMESDLTVIDAEVQKNNISFKVANLGMANAENVKVSIAVNGSKVYNSSLDLKFNSSQEIKYQTSGDLTGKAIFIEVDPENEIFESNEENNNWGNR